MSDLTPYLNDPDIIKEPTALREVHAVRLKIADEMRSFSLEERTARVHKEAGEVMAQFGLNHLRMMA